MATQLDNSYVKHWDFSGTRYVEGYDNRFVGYLDHDGTVAGSMLNSYGVPSVLSGIVYRFLFLRLLIGRATGYPGFPDGAPYIKLSFITRRRSYGILLGQRGFVYIRLDRKTI